MAGTLTISTLSDGTNSTSATNCIQGSAKAWVNFNGTGTVAINASYNVSSITDNGTGDYTVNFTNAFVDTSYSIIGSVINGQNADAVVVAGVPGVPNPTPPTTTATRFQVRYAPGNSLFDSSVVNIAVFR